MSFAGAVGRGAVSGVCQGGSVHPAGLVCLAVVLGRLSGVRHAGATLFFRRSRTFCRCPQAPNPFTYGLDA